MPPDGSSDRLMHSALLDAIRGLRWRARRASRIAVPGIHPSRVRGSSAEFTEYRAYRQGDDLRRIDWKLFARSDRAHVRISEERAVTPTYIVVDASASMAFPDGATSKWSLVQQLTVALTAVAHSSGDPAGVIVAGNPRATVQPRTRHGLVAEVSRMLQHVKVSGGVPIAPTVAIAARAASRVAIISDFLGDLDETLQTARQLIASGRDVYALHIIAAEEMDPPATISVVTDPETDAVHRSLSVDTRKEYTRAFGAWRDDVASRWLASGAAYREIVTGNEPVSSVVRRIVRDEPVASRAG
ncbi:MAG TPA: DUF58 domain-containing protein [Gemmatimonadaceae bacterium]